MRILDTIEHDYETAATYEVLKVGVLRCGGMVGGDALMRCFAGSTVESSAVLIADRDLALFGEFDNFLNFGAIEAFCDDYTFEGASGAKRFPDRMDSSENCHYNE